MVAAAARFLLIISLGTWSPAWCCCAVRAMAAGEAACTAAAERFSCCSRTASSQPERDGRGCCETATSKCGESDDDQSPCRCADRVIEQQRLDTSLKVSPPRFDSNSFAAAVHSALEAPSIAAPQYGAPGHDAWPHPPPHTLLAQHCLLLL